MVCNCDSDLIKLDYPRPVLYTTTSSLSAKDKVLIELDIILRIFLTHSLFNYSYVGSENVKLVKDPYIYIIIVFSYKFS